METYDDDLILLSYKSSTSISNILRNNDNLKLRIINTTSFINSNRNIKILERLWYIKNGIFKEVSCEICCGNTSVDYKKNKIKCCSRKCTMSKIDPKTGLTGYEINAKKIKESNSKIDPETGLTGYQKGSNNKIKSQSIINPETGLTSYEMTGLKIKESNSKIDPETGLTSYEMTGLKIKESNSKIDPKTGLTGYQKGAKKTSNIRNLVDPETGLTGYQKGAKKYNITMNEVDPEKGLTGYQELQIKRNITMNEVDPKTGLTGYQTAGLNSKKILSKVDPETGLTGYQTTGLKISKSVLISSYKRKSFEFPTGYKLLTTEDDYIKKLYNILKYKCLKCNTIRESAWPYIRCLKCFPYNKSIGENEVLEFCNSLNTSTVSNSKSIISPLELDIYIPDHNLAIEYNGLFWHSSYSIESENRDYHLMKTRECEKQGIQLFHIFENEWQNPQKQLIWKSIIKNRLGKSERIFARKTEIRSVSSTEKSEFLISNHLQGDCVSSVNLGLFLEDDLVSLMTFGRSRYDKKIEWELLRFCNRVGHSVIGGASKLLKSFTLNQIGSIISYADKRRSSGNLYKKLGFDLSRESGPNYFYWKPGSMMLESRIKYQKHKLKDELDEFDPKLTESENMYINGYRKIYDCGNQVWILKMGISNYEFKECEGLHI